MMSLKINYVGATVEIELPDDVLEPYQVKIERTVSQGLLDLPAKIQMRLALELRDVKVRMPGHPSGELILRRILLQNLSGELRPDTDDMIFQWRQDADEVAPDVIICENSAAEIDCHGDGQAAENGRQSPQP